MVASFMRARVVLAGIGFIAVLGVMVVVGSRSDPLATSASAVGELYDPVEAGEPTPPGYRALLRRDAIEPVYDPTFLPAGEVDWSGGTLVLGVAAESESKAYPVPFLNFREMVIDELEGEPILVSW